MNLFQKTIRRFSELYHRSSIRYTVFLSFTLSALIAILMTGVTFYMRFSEQLDSTTRSENRIIVEQVAQSLNAHIRRMIRLSNVVTYQVIKNADVEYETAEDPEARDAGDVKNQLELLYEENSNYIKSIALFSDEGELLVEQPAAQMKAGIDVTEQEWFKKALERPENLHFSTPSVVNLFEGDETQNAWTLSLSCAAEITQDKAVKQGVLRIDLRYNGIAELFNGVTLSNNGYVYLIDRSGEIIYHPKQQLIATGLVREGNMQLANHRDGEYEIESESGRSSVIIRSAGYTAWEIVGVIPQQGLTLDSMQNILFLLTIFLLYFAIIILVNSFISDKLTDPIQNLELSVQQVERDMEHAEIYTGGSYEIQQLGHSVQQMVDIMRKLTRDIVYEQERKRKTELDALQAQINPHFLYNTLDILVWMIEKGQPEQALKIVSALARFFRISLSKGKNIIPVRNELEHVRNYLMIQQLRYKNKFNYSIEADEDALELSTIKLVLQPLVENAIYHSMDFMTDGEGQIDILARRQGDELYLSVKDNGLGMTKDVVAKLLVEAIPISQGSGIGLKNVHERIRLYFGEQYGVIIESEPDEGTCITLHMPAAPCRETEEAL